MQKDTIDTLRNQRSKSGWNFRNGTHKALENLYSYAYRNKHGILLPFEPSDSRLPGIAAYRNMCRPRMLIVPNFEVVTDRLLGVSQLYFIPRIETIPQPDFYDPQTDHTPTSWQILEPLVPHQY